MLKCMDRYVQNPPQGVAEVDYNNITFCYDAPMIKQVASTFVQVMIMNFGAVEFTTLKDIQNEKEE